MVIDFHTHIFPDKIAEKTIEKLADLAGVKAACNGTLGCLLDTMQRAEVDLSVIQPVITNPAQFKTVNDYAASLNKNYAGRLLSFGGIHPDSADYKKELDYIKSLGLKGIKIHPDYQRVMIDDVRFLRIIEYANELGLIILTHAGIDIGLQNPVHCPPDKMRKVLDQLKPEKMVLGHYGGWKQWDEVYDCLAGADVYLDTAFTFDYIEDEQFIKILNKHDYHKILFATDSPWSDVKEGVEILRNMPLTDEVIDAVLYKNAAQLLGIQV